MKRPLLVLALATTALVGLGESASRSAAVSHALAIAPPGEIAPLAVTSEGSSHKATPMPRGRASALGVARPLGRTRLHRSALAEGTAQSTTSLFAAADGRAAPDGASNSERFVALGLPDPRAP